MKMKQTIEGGVVNIEGGKKNVNNIEITINQIINCCGGDVECIKAKAAQVSPKIMGGLTGPTNSNNQGKINNPNYQNNGLHGWQGAINVQRYLKNSGNVVDINITEKVNEETDREEKRLSEEEKAIMDKVAEMRKDEIRKDEIRKAEIRKAEMKKAEIRKAEMKKAENGSVENKRDENLDKFGMLLAKIIVIVSLTLGAEHVIKSSVSPKENNKTSFQKENNVSYNKAKVMQMFKQIKENK